MYAFMPFMGKTEWLLLWVLIRSDLSLQAYLPLLSTIRDLRDGEPFPREMLQPVRQLWLDSTVQEVVLKSPDSVVPEK